MNVGWANSSKHIFQKPRKINQQNAPFYNLYVLLMVHVIMCMVFVYSILLTWLKLNTAQGSQNKAKVMSAEPLKMGSYSQTWNWKLDQTIKEND